MEDEVLVLKQKIKDYQNDFEYQLGVYGKYSKSTLYSAIKLIMYTSKKFGMYNAEPHGLDYNLCKEVCSLNYVDLMDIADSNLIAGSVSIVRYTMAQKLINDELNPENPESLRKNIEEIKNAFTQKDIDYFSKYQDLKINPEILIFIDKYNKSNPFKNWGAYYRYMLPFIYNDKQKYVIWNALETIKDNLLKDLGLQDDWECNMIKGWGNNVRSYYGFEGPSNYGSQRAVIMLHPKAIADHKNSAQLVCYFVNGTIYFGMDIGINARNYKETNWEENNWKYIKKINIFPNNNLELKIDAEEIYNNILRYLSAEPKDKSIEINNNLIKNYYEIKSEYIAEADAVYSDEDGVNLYLDDAKAVVSNSQIPQTETSSDGGNKKPPANNIKTTFDDDGDSSGDFNKNFSDITIEDSQKDDLTGETEDAEEKTVSKLYPNIKSNEDYLERNAYAEFIADEFITKKSVEPLNIAIYGNWGAGKTQFFNLIKNRIFKIGEDLKNKNNKELREIAKNTICIDFNALKYNEQEYIWAALIHQITNACKRDIITYFRFIWYKFVDYWTKHWQENLYKFILVWIMFGIIAYFSSILGENNKYITLYRNIASLDFTHKLLLCFFLALTTDVLKPLFADIIKFFSKIFATQKCDEILSFNNEVEHTVKAALQALCNNGKNRVALFIDNLDRCSYKNIKQILDSIILFLDILNEVESPQNKYMEIINDPKRIECNNQKQKNIEIFTIFAINQEILKLALKDTLKSNNEEFSPSIYLEKIVNMELLINKPKEIETLVSRLFGPGGNQLKYELEKEIQNKNVSLRTLTNKRYSLILEKFINDLSLSDD